MSKWKVVGKIDGHLIVKIYDQEYKANEVTRTLNDVFAPFRSVEVDEDENIHESKPVTADPSQEIPF